MTGIFNQVFFRSAILSQGAWVAAGQLLSALGALVTIRVMTELLTPADFGRLMLLVGVAALALGLASTPRLQALIRYYPDWARIGRTSVLRQVGARLVTAQAAIATFAIALGWMVIAPQFGEPWFSGWLIAALLIVDCVRSFELALLNAARRQQGAAFIHAADAWARPLAAIMAILVLGASADAALLGYIIGAGLTAAVALAIMPLEGRSEARTAPEASPAPSEADLAASIRRYALPLAPLALFGWISGMGDRYVIGGLLGLEQAGFYAAAYGLASRPFLMFSSIAEMTLRPVLQNAIAAGDAVLIVRAKRALFLVTATGAALGVLAFFLLSDWVGGLLLAETYRPAAKLMPWIALGYGLYAVSNVFSRFCYAFDDTRAILILTVAGALIGLAAMVPAILTFGLHGAALAVSISFGIQLLLAYHLSRRAEAQFRRQPCPIAHRLRPFQKKDENDGQS